MIISRFSWWIVLFWKYWYWKRGYICVLGPVLSCLLRNYTIHQQSISQNDWHLLCTFRKDSQLFSPLVVHLDCVFHFHQDKFCIYENLWKKRGFSEHPSSPPIFVRVGVTRSLVLCIVFYRLLVVPLSINS